MNAIFQSLQDQIRSAHALQLPLRIGGGGSKHFWVRPQGSQVLDMRLYTGVVDYQPSELVLTVRAGTSLSDIEHLLDQQGQMLGFEPPHFGPDATIGGTLACGLSGPRRASVGSARDFVLGVRILDGLGRDLSFGGRVIKNVAGFDVSRLMVGAWGTLGALMEVSLKVLPKPPFETTLEWAMTELEALESMNQWAGQPLPLSATSYQNGRLRVRLSGAEVAVRAAMRHLGGEVIPEGPAWWLQVREQRAAGFSAQRPLWRLSVRSNAPPLGFSGAVLTEWGGSLRWIASDHAPAQLQRAAQEAGGHALLFRGGDPFRPLGHPLDPVLMNINKNIKQVFDPNNILNQGLGV